MKRSSHRLRTLESIGFGLESNTAVSIHIYIATWNTFLPFQGCYILYMYSNPDTQLKCKVAKVKVAQPATRAVPLICLVAIYLKRFSVFRLGRLEPIHDWGQGQRPTFQDRVSWRCLYRVKSMPQAVDCCQSVSRCFKQIEQTSSLWRSSDLCSEGEGGGVREGGRSAVTWPQVLASSQFCSHMQARHEPVRFSNLSR